MRSTSLITRQTEALREQQDHLDRLVAEHKRDTQARAALEVQQLKGLEERQRDLVQSVSFTFSYDVTTNTFRSIRDLQGPNYF